MKVAFRVDASLVMGNGHVMRCLTLAACLRESGAECLFICREHQGNLIRFICDKGFPVSSLPVEDVGNFSENGYQEWLGTTQERDADICKKVLEVFSPDWLVVDHYGLDACWELSVSSFFKQLLVIDDLANRAHACNVLLDQNLGRSACDYKALVPNDCMLLVGPLYALLRPEFSKLRGFSLQRRSQALVKRLLITMGGVDRLNATGQVINALRESALPEDCHISIVMGINAPWLEQVKVEAERLSWKVEVLVSVEDMARQMANSDLVIGAAGSTSWERCCLGVPSILVVLAENQLMVAKSLQDCGAVRLLDIRENFEGSLKLELQSLLANMESVRELSINSAAITDGRGVMKIAGLMSNYSHAGGEL
ncbi:TPA: UDP-2,4-diacetamido-2,4,6-trideoxy-beta-L-altropyranose hydrolase [Pseudomonas aeruginosa]|nr:UDP-2,4-diacetamido-2,4,6-trideoxy-beta-L-altropyranose hydrolase [Pseudomonas aeruginosa]MCO5624340.1 UDP-2,4-diacetamido-2,4,6-trideoxy-beta-L-altropyranose hydrolase [Pseudomonas aeruginosa]HCL3683369.1 UDP-2,4-diacetamido-2,4,6-trideoxy-beta-L-altropyranose hydrolase [Pseudomonas aeruginosa]HDY5313137.1 UDP-2,4-diacetamido-2,4,6-trideoxy-beta-L-altropyranose hydrolase [Pseudomonas aeruginosa]